ncbi:hypothetical protein C7S18_17685 [Ahniella affigens]|uniref:Uncharacterized protein n=1 Tax=Ahniella affigens TaxID=2021234 RepID=A0A2P1PVL6_9GAMM|nr:hypothetical protein C7S18_17685 [Ahniella affigens]
MQMECQRQTTDLIDAGVMRAGGDACPDMSDASVSDSGCSETRGSKNRRARLRAGLLVERHNYTVMRMS